jgi:hypothetical protein
MQQKHNLRQPLGHTAHRLKTEKKGKRKENTELQKKTEPEKQICKTKTKN